MHVLCALNLQVENRVKNSFFYSLLFLFISLPSRCTCKLGGIGEKGAERGDTSPPPPVFTPFFSSSVSYK